MINGFIVSTLTAIIVYFYISESIALKILATFLTILAFAYLFLKEKIEYNHYKNQVALFQDGFSEPFINVNKVSWKVLMLIPNIDKMTAKHIVHNRRHFGNYKSLRDFFKINQIPKDKKEVIKKYIII